MLKNICDTTFQGAFSSYLQSFAVCHHFSERSSYGRARSCEMCQEGLWGFIKEISWLDCTRNFLCKYFYINLLLTISQNKVSSFVQCKGLPGIFLKEEWPKGKSLVLNILLWASIIILVFPLYWIYFTGFTYYFLLGTDEHVDVFS